MTGRPIGPIPSGVEYACHAELLGAKRVVRLIVRMRHDQHRPTGTKRRRCRADAAVMNDRGRMRETAPSAARSPAVSIDRGTGTLRTIPRIRSDQQDGATADRLGRRDALVIEGPGGTNRGAAKREHDRRLPFAKKLRNRRRQGAAHPRKTRNRSRPFPAASPVAADQRQVRTARACRTARTVPRRADHPRPAGPARRETPESARSRAR